jgi:hypothetical protein
MNAIAMYKKRISRSLRDCRLKPSLRLCLFEEEFCLDLFGFLVALPFLDRWRREPHEIMESWGVYYSERSVVWCWGDYCKFFHMPWDLVHLRDAHQVLRADGTWAPFVGSWERDKQPDRRHAQNFSYQYTLKSGEVQHRTATIWVERREWRQKWLRWCPWFAKKSQYIKIEFSDEVGERTGSWKGGCVGCAYDMLPGETPEQTLRRMEAERKF